jgi:hypothetical protein
MLVDARLTDANDTTERATALGMIKEHIGRGSPLSGDKNRVSRRTTATPFSNRCPHDTPSWLPRQRGKAKTVRKKFG